MNSWIILILAGFFEVGFTFSLGKAKETSGNTQYAWYTAFVVSLIFSMTLLMKATQHLPIGTAYVVWSGIGAIGTALLGIFVFNEPLSFWRILFLFLLISSIVGLKVVSPK